MATLAENLNQIKGGLENKLKTDFNSFIGNQKTTYEIEDVRLDIIGNERVSMENDVTDHYVETNIAYQDQVSIKPVTYTISGEIGELVYYKNDNDESVLGAVPEKLTAIASFVPPTTAKVNQIRNKAIKISNMLNSVDNFANRMSKLSDVSDMQTKAFNRLSELRAKRTPVNIKCPWGILTKFIITRLEFVQSDKTKDKTSITISFKEIKTTRVGETLFEAERFNGIGKAINAPVVEKGQTTGSDIQIEEKSWAWFEKLSGKTF